MRIKCFHGLGTVGMLLTLATSAAAAFRIDPVLRTGQVAPGGNAGHVSVMGLVAIDNRGDWYILHSTDVPDPGRDLLFSTPTGTWLREGDLLNGPTGAVLSNFDDIDISATTAVVQKLEYTAAGATRNGIYFNRSLFVNEGDLVAAPGLPAGTTMASLVGCKTNASHQVLVRGNLNDGTDPTRFSLITYDNVGGSPSNPQVRFIEGGEIPGVGTISGIGVGAKDFDLADNGSVITSLTYLGQPSTANTGVTIYDQVTGTYHEVAHEDAPSPAPDRLWSDLSNKAVALNDNGDWALIAGLKGDTNSNNVLVKNGQVIRQEGQLVELLNGTYEINDFYSGSKVLLDDAGNMVYALTVRGGSTTTNTALFYNDTLIAQRGVTTFDGIELNGVVYDDLPLDAIFPGNMYLSPNGDWLIFEGGFRHPVTGNVYETAFVVAIPEPATALLLGVGLALGILRRR